MVNHLSDENYMIYIISYQKENLNSSLSTIVNRRKQVTDRLISFNQYCCADNHFTRCKQLTN